MEEVLTRAFRDLRIVLRWVTSGFVGLFVLWLIAGDPNILKTLGDKIGSWWFVAIIPTVYAMSVYSLHKAFVHPVLHQVVVSPLASSLAQNRSYKNAIIQDLRRSIRRDLRSPAGEVIQRDLDRFANVFHCIYCSSWVIVSMPLLIINTVGEANGADQHVAIGIGVVFFLVAFYSDCRQTARELWVDRNPEELHRYAAMAGNTAYPLTPAATGSTNAPTEQSLAHESPDSDYSEQAAHGSLPMAIRGATAQ